MKKYLYIGFALALLVSCNNSNEVQPRIEYSDSDQSELTIDSVLSDTARMLVAKFPIHFDTTRVLIHPIGLESALESEKRRTNYLSSKEDLGYMDDSYTVIYSLRGDEVSGNMLNLIFEDVDTQTGLRPLTDKILNITKIAYLRKVAKTTNRHYLLYQLQDGDSNRDGAINSKDVTSLYISKLDGTDFKKINPDYQQFIDGNWYFEFNRYYFKTLEDVNKDGKFDKRDMYHYFYLDFSVNPYKLVGYDPLSIVKK